jgi:hypothetical protein
MDNAEQNDPAVAKSEEPSTADNVTDKDTISPSDDSKMEPIDDDGALPAGADEKKQDEPDEEPANAADKEYSGEEKDHPKSPHAHEGERHDDVETEDADDRAVLEPPGGDDDADMGSEVDQEAMQCDDAEPHDSDSDDVPASGGDLSQYKSISRRAAIRWMLPSKAPTSPKRRSQRLASKFTPIKAEQANRRGTGFKAASKGSDLASKPSTSAGRRDRPVKSAVVPAAKAASGHRKHVHNEGVHSGHRRTLHCPARTSVRQDGVRPNKAKPKLLALDSSNDAAVVKTCTSK